MGINDSKETQSASQCQGGNDSIKDSPRNVINDRSINSEKENKCELFAYLARYTHILIEICKLVGSTAADYY